MALFTHGWGWSKEQVDSFVVDVKKEMKDTKMHAYWSCKYSYSIALQILMWCSEASLTWLGWYQVIEPLV